VFQPKHIKQAKLLRKGVKKFLHYKRDLIPEEKLADIEKVATEFDEAVASKNKAEIEKVAKRLTGTCEKAVPAASNAGLRENLEVIFVAVVIAVGIRAYVLQPFKIPTGSMQPTLNGIIAYPQSETEYTEEKPGLPGKVWASAFAGRKYVNEVMEEDKELVAVTTGTKLKFFPYTTFFFRDGTKRTIKLPLATLRNPAGAKGTGFGFNFTFEYERKRQSRRPFNAGNTNVEPLRLPKGKVIARGYVDTGDQVLVDKISYHFRQPKRGEVFVFSTKNIEGIKVPEEQGSQHYIKRLVGVPEDKLEVRDGQLFVNGKRAEESGMGKVMDTYPKTHPKTHSGYGGAHRFDLTGKREYIAMGDNSSNSADSRTWGTVPEVNVVGPAFVVYWPFAHHWGRIR
jgi:signal peptidase I